MLNENFDCLQFIGRKECEKFCVVFKFWNFSKLKSGW